MLALALARELTPVVTSIILAGRVGSAFAAELGTMQARVWGEGGGTCSAQPLPITWCHPGLGCLPTPPSAPPAGV